MSTEAACIRARLVKLRDLIGATGYLRTAPEADSCHAVATETVKVSVDAFVPHCIFHAVGRGYSRLGAAWRMAAGPYIRVVRRPVGPRRV